MPKVDIIIIALASPILIGIYKDGVLLRELQSQEQSSEYLPKVFKSLLDEYEIASITYANGPGSFMAIKISYLFLKSLEIVKNIKLYAALAFEFNEYTPIKALGKLYFHFDNGEITTRPLENETLVPMSLPKVLKLEKYSTLTEPNYILPAVH